MLQRVIQGSDGKLSFGPEGEANYFVAGTALRHHQGKLFSDYSWTTDHPMHDLEGRYKEDTDVHFDELNALAAFKGDHKQIASYLFKTDPDVLKLQAQSFDPTPPDPKEGPRTRRAVPVACSPVKPTDTFTIEEKQFNRVKQHEINKVKQLYIDWSNEVSKFIKEVTLVKARKAPKESPVVGRAAYNAQVQKVAELQKKLKDIKNIGVDEAALKKAEFKALDATAGEAAWKSKYEELYKKKLQLDKEIEGLKGLHEAAEKALSEKKLQLDRAEAHLQTQQEHNQTKLELAAAKGHQEGFQKGLDQARGSHSSSRSAPDNPLNDSFYSHHQLALMGSQPRQI